jgi:hypothetical protein
MYCGGAWVPVLNLLADPKNHVWIVSAGHGLLSPEAEIPPYSATFSMGQPDSVAPPPSPSFTTQDWWNECCRMRSNRIGPSCLADVAKGSPDTPLIAALSTEYLDAVRFDLIEARESLSSPNLLIIISSGSRKDGIFADNLLPCDSRMENKVGMGRSSLNVRILHHVMRRYSDKLSAPLLRNIYGRIQNTLQKSTYPSRSRATDEEVIAFIRSSTTKSASLSHSRLLRQFRDSGMACEQSRFRTLFTSLTTK